MTPPSDAVEATSAFQAKDRTPSWTDVVTRFGGEEETSAESLGWIVNIVLGIFLSPEQGMLMSTLVTLVRSAPPPIDVKSAAVAAAATLIFC